MSDDLFLGNDATEGDDNTLILDLSVLPALIEITPGEYNVVIDRIKRMPAKPGKYPSVAINMTITAPQEFAGAELTDFATLSPNAMKYGLGLAAYLRAMKINVQAGQTRLQLDLDDWIGWEGNVIVELQEYEGNEQIRVVRVKPFRELTV